MLDEVPDELLGFRMCSKPGAQSKNGLPFHILGEKVCRKIGQRYGSRRCRREGLSHVLRLSCGDDSLSHVGRCDGYQASASVKGSLAGKNCSAGFSQRPGKQKYVAK